LIFKLIPENQFDALKIPLTIAATNLNKGQAEYFTRGELIPVILASCCVPVIFAPVEFNGSLYVDGGITDNLPTKPIRDQCEILIGSHCNYVSNEFDVRNFRSVIERSLLMAIGGNTLVSKNLCDVLIEAPEMGNTSAFDLSDIKRLYTIGYEFTKRTYTENSFISRSRK
jgi:NTE family protein